MIYDLQADLHGTESVVYIAVRNYSIQCELTLLLDAGIETSACARNSTTSTSSVVTL